MTQQRRAPVTPVPSGSIRAITMKSSTRVIPNRRLLLVYAIPYFVYVGIASLFAGYLSLELIYALRLFVVSGLIVWAWRWYVPLKGPKSPWACMLTGTVAGLAGAAFWSLCCGPLPRKT